MNLLSNEIQAAVIGVDEVARSAELRWGIGRLPRLVSDATRLKFKAACEMFNQTIQANDTPRIAAVAAMMRRAWAAMATEAEAAGAQPLSPLVWEALMPNGTVLAVVRTQAEASAVAAQGRKVTVYTMDEVARVLASATLLNAVKTEFPGARVNAVTKRSEGFAQDWATNDPLLEMIHETEMEIPA